MVPDGFIPPRAGKAALRQGKQTLATVYPRARGRVGHLRRIPLERGFIPARAGEGADGLSAGTMKKVYPRARGRGPVPDLTARIFEGLSPRARERGPSSRDATVLFRFIPARAGEGGNAGHLRQVVTVYPRACWWKAGAAARRAKDPPVPTAVSPVYPRARGGRLDLGVQGGWRLHFGLSPRAWGKVVDGPARNPLWRFILARVWGEGGRRRRCSLGRLVYSRA